MPESSPRSRSCTQITGQTGQIASFWTLWTVRKWSLAGIIRVSLHNNHNQHCFTLSHGVLSEHGDSFSALGWGFVLLLPAKPAKLDVMNMIGPKGDLFKGRKGRLEVVGNLGDDSIALAVSSAPAVETPTSDSGRSDAALDVSPPEPLVIVPRGCAVKKPRSIPTPVVPDPPLPVVPLVQSYARKRG